MDPSVWAKDVEHWARQTLPNTFTKPRSVRQLHAFIKEALTNITQFGEDAANRYGDGYTIPEATLDEDEDNIRRNTLEGATRTRLQELDSDPTKGRLNLERVNRHLSDGNPHKPAMKELAQGGVPIPTPPDFIPNMGPGGAGIPRPSNQTKHVAAALRKMIYDGFRQPKLCFIVRASTAQTLVPRFHCSPAQWAPKDGKEEGRNCNNCSYCKDGHNPLNGEWLRQDSKSRWNAIQHPTLEDFVLMIVGFAKWAVDTGQGARAIRLWKMDLKGAYTLISYTATDVHLMACSVPDDLVVFFLCGTFGWGGTPYAFQVVTRAITWELNEGTRNDDNGAPQPRLSGRALMYVDDIAGVSFNDNVEDDLRHTKQFVEDLLGLGAVADKKTERDGEAQFNTPGQLDFIGYSVDLQQTPTGINLLTSQAGIARKNVVKALVALHAIGDGQNVHVKAVQRVASHASRYKRVCPLMAPFCRALHAATKNHDKLSRPWVSLTPRAVCAVAILSVLLLMSEVQQTGIRRTFSSFVTETQQPTHIIEYDASLWGLAIIWFELRDGVEVAVGSWRTTIEHWGLDKTKWKSKWMNTVEFIAQTVGLLGLAERGVRDAAVKIRGDNRAALAWGMKRASRGVWSDKTAMLQAAIRHRFGLEVVEEQHLPNTKEHDFNWRCDLPSRGKADWETILRMDKEDKVTGPRLGEEMTTWKVSEAAECLRLGDPRGEGEMEKEGIGEFMRGVEALVNRVAGLE